MSRRAWGVLAAAVLAAVVYGLCRWTSPGPGGAGRPVTVTPPTAQKPPAAVSLPPATDGQDRSRPVSRGLMRIITPVRLPSELGPDLDRDVAETREILDRFRKGGFEYAVWAVADLPSAQTNVAAWAKSCLDAFPGRTILALDIHLENGKVLPEEHKLTAFLAEALPAVDSVLLNYTALNNTSAGVNEAIAAVKANADLVSGISRNKPQWLYIDWEKEPDAETLSVWTDAFAASVHGFFVYHSHEWNVEQHPVCVKAGESLLSLGKPVVRVGFRYTSARSRPGIETDLAENYVQRIGVYEEWVQTQAFAGYCRVLGDSVPGAVHPNLDFLPEKQLSLRSAAMEDPR